MSSQPRQERRLRLRQRRAADELRHPREAVDAKARDGRPERGGRRLGEGRRREVRGADGRRIPGGVELGFGRTVASEIEAPNMLANLV